MTIHYNYDTACHHDKRLKSDMTIILLHNCSRILINEGVKSSLLHACSMFFGSRTKEIKYTILHDRPMIHAFFE